MQSHTRVKIDSPEALEAKLLSDFKVVKNMIPCKIAGESNNQLIMVKSFLIQPSRRKIHVQTWAIQLFHKSWEEVLFSEQTDFDSLVNLEILVPENYYQSNSVEEIENICSFEVKSNDEI